MDIRQLAKKPQLTKITLDTPEFVEQYGEPIEFYTWDRVTTDSFVKLASLTDATHTGQIFEVMKDFIMDADGKPVLTDENTLPTDVLVAAMSAVSDSLGKF